MRRFIIFSLAVTGIITSFAASAQNALPSYEGSPDTYKVIFEDQNFRVIDAIWKADQTDKPHTHPVPSVIYNITGCTLKVHGADGKIREVHSKPDTAGALPIITQPHTAENVGSKDCHAIFVEQK
ncbi:MAG TPA: hypothetical protein VHY35_18455 [Stellaceae bacterium]|jgi:hypothetical protein|nr:hypothetical protein [Stellaceae bacterium]